MNKTYVLLYNAWGTMALAENHPLGVFWTYCGSHLQRGLVSAALLDVPSWLHLYAWQSELLATTHAEQRGLPDRMRPACLLCPTDVDVALT